jgi:vitamin B12 transporter
MRARTIAAAAILWTGTAAAQGFPLERAGEARAAVEACAEAAGRRDAAAARPATERALALLQGWLQAEPRAVEPRVRLAAVRSRCEIPFAEMMAAGALVAEANGLLEDALRLDSTHWEARFTLAMNHAHTPEFLGRTPDAIRHLERLLRQQGDAADPHHALPYLHLGDLYLRTGRTADAGAVWRRGAALFPDDPRFEQRLGGGGPAASAGVERTTLLLAPIVVEGGNRLDDARGATSLRRIDVLTTPGGTADVMHAFQTAPGATRAAEGSDLYVRGGDPAETPVFVDGARLIHPGRYETLDGAAFGVLDAQVLRSAYFAAGGFSARYGNALSGVLDVATVGRPVVRGARFNASTVQVGTAVEVPLGPRAGSWLSVRGTDGRLMLAMHGRSGEFERPPTAAEGILGYTWTPRAGTEVKAVAMADEDAVGRVVNAYGWEGAFRSRGSNRLAAVSGRTLLVDDRLAVRGSLSGAERTSRFRFGVLDRERSDRGLTLRTDTDLALRGGGRVSVGVEATRMEAVTLGTVPTGDRLAPGSASRELPPASEEARHLGAYVEHERALGADLAVIAGARIDHLPGESSATVDPRLAIAYRAGGWTLRLGGGVFHQGRWRRRFLVPDAGSPSGTPTRARHLVLGAERGGEPSVRIEAYAKRYDAYAPAGEGPAIAAAGAAGIDAIVRWTRQRGLNGWITYGYLDARLRLEDGTVLPSAVDVTHSLTGVARLMVRPGWELGSTLRLGSGRPFTPVTGEDAFGGPVHGAPHGARLPAYARLDGRLTRYLPTGARVGVLYVEGLNLLDRQNVSGYTYAAGYADRRPIHAYFSERTLVLGVGVNFR